MILLVEDNEDDIELTLRAFRKGGLQTPIVVSRDGEEALARLLDDSAELPQVVLLDLKLPKVDGLEVLRRVRAHPRTKFLPVVVLTSSLEERDMVESYSLGANSYVRKPVSFADFTEAVRHLGVYWLDLNRTVPDGGRR
jgi:two-component system response regulator